MDAVKTAIDLITENAQLRQRSRELLAQTRLLVAEHQDILVLDVQCAKEWRMCRRDRP
jgi:hypothetical protein